METSYKGYVVIKYTNANNGVRWSVETIVGTELLFDQTRKYLCTRYIDSLVRQLDMLGHNYAL